VEVVGIGNALMDLIAFVDEDFAPSLGFHNNAVVHMDRARIEKLLPALPEYVASAGGGAANTARAAALLGVKAAFAGVVGEDRLGTSYIEELVAGGVEPLVRLSNSATGVYCSLIRPDGGRTLLVSPGAALDICREAPPPAMFRPDAIFFADGFLMNDRLFFVECVRKARASGMEVVVDVASQSMAMANRDFLLEFLPDNCDILFANEDEFASLSGLPLREGLELFGTCELELVVKRAERGAVWARAGEIIDSPVREVRPVDETGAGDAFAAGFLVGRDRGLPPERCLRLGNRVAEEVLGVPALGVDKEKLRRIVEAVSE